MLCYLPDAADASRTAEFPAKSRGDRRARHDRRAAPAAARALERLPGAAGCRAAGGRTGAAGPPRRPRRQAGHPRRRRLGRWTRCSAGSAFPTLGSHLRSYAWGNVLQLEKAGRELLARLSREAPLLPGADVLAFIDVDSTQKRVHGHEKEGARFGHTKMQEPLLLLNRL